VRASTKTSVSINNGFNEDKGLVTVASRVCRCQLLQVYLGDSRTKAWRWRYKGQYGIVWCTQTRPHTHLHSYTPTQLYTPSHSHTTCTCHTHSHLHMCDYMCRACTSHGYMLTCTHTHSHTTRTHSHTTRTHSHYGEVLQFVDLRFVLSYLGGDTGL
jgi:hypothetical protein